MLKPANFRFDLKLILLGFFVALFSAGIGIGGGTLFVSILMSSVFGFDFKRASSTSLATIIPISLIGSISHIVLLSEITHLRFYFTFIPACVLGTFFGMRIVRRRHNGMFRILFSVFLLLISLRMMKVFDFPFLIYNGLHHLILSSSELILIVPIGILIGTLAVLLGIGCGLLIVPFFLIIMKLNIHEAITLSLTTMFFITLSATIIHNKFKSLDIISVKSLFFPALIGAVSGAVLSSYLPAPILKKLFGLFLFIMACKYIIHDIFIKNNMITRVKKLHENLGHVLK